MDAHAHADKNLLGLPWHKNQTPGPRIRDFVDNERRVRRELGLSAQEQSAQQVRAALAAGMSVDTIISTLAGPAAVCCVVMIVIARLQASGTSRAAGG